MEWQAIETAPKDGTAALTWGGGILKIRRFHQASWRDLETQQRAKYNPTHWMPLPPPPKEKPTEVG